jgi:tRNA (cmo5U34)-methyltransferase
MSKNADTLYSQPLEAITGFVFDQSVVRVFQDMIGRSVPGYATLLSMLPVLAQQYAQDNSHCYDLGCSLGAVSLALRHSIDRNNLDIIAVDNSPDMITQCETYFNQDNHPIPVKLHCADVTDIEIHDASIVVMNFTLQFISPEKRQSLIDSIYSGLKPGGVLVLSEKLLFSDHEQLLMNTLHQKFKKLNGYSDLEISQKRSALEHVLISDTLETHKQRLQSAGFTSSTLWFQCFNFVSLLAIK